MYEHIPNGRNEIRPFQNLADRLVPKPEAMHMLGLKSPTSIYRLIELGQLSDRKLLGKRVFMLSELQALVAGER